MDIKKAIELLMSKYPGQIPNGYWVKSDAIVINTRPIKALRGMTSPSQFAITEKGEVYGVTPMMYDLSIEDMKTL